MVIKNEKLKITDSKGNSYYGGNQDWYSSNTRAMGGCGSVAGANSLRSLALTDKACHDAIKNSSALPREIKSSLILKNCSRDDFLMLMTGVYGTMRAFEIFPFNVIYNRSKRGLKVFKYLKPNNGRSSIGFIRGVVRYASKIGLNLEYRALPTAFCDKEKALLFIKEGLKASGSVTILTSYNKHTITALDSSQKMTMRCHFATITDCSEDTIIISTWGRAVSMDIDEWVKSLCSIRAWESTLFYFVPTTKQAMRKSLHTAWIPFVRGIFQALTRKAQ